MLPQASLCCTTRWLPRWVALQTAHLKTQLPAAAFPGPGHQQGAGNADDLLQSFWAVTATGSRAQAAEICLRYTHRLLPHHDMLQTCPAAPRLSKSCWELSSFEKKKPGCAPGCWVLLYKHWLRVYHYPYFFSSPRCPNNLITPAVWEPRERKEWMHSKHTRLGLCCFVVFQFSNTFLRGY